MIPTPHVSDDQLADTTEPHASALLVGIISSFALHISIFGFIFFKQLNATPAEVLQLDIAMAVSITSVNPQRRQQAVSGQALENQIPLPGPSSFQQDEIAESSAEEQAIPQIDTAPETIAITRETASNNLDTDGVPSELPNAEENEDSANPGIDAAMVGDFVNTYITNYKGSLTTDWLTACMKYQKEHGVDFCPPADDGKSATTRSVTAATVQMFGTYVTNAAANARASRQLLDEMAAAARLYMDENSIMGELARQRYQLAQANYCRLNPCRGISLGASTVFATPVSNEGGITILTFGLGNITLFSGLMSVSFKDGVRFMDKQQGRMAPFIPYRFTATPVQQAENADDFKVEAPLFPLQQ